MMHTWESIIHREDCDVVARKLDLTGDRNEPWTLEYRIHHRDGTIRWVYEKGVAICDSHGKVICLDGVIFDITKLKEAEEEIRALRNILPICSYCKKIRNDEGYYEQLEEYFHKHSGVDFSHTICPACMRNHYPEYNTDSH